MTASKAGTGEFDGIPLGGITSGTKSNFFVADPTSSGSVPGPLE